MRPAFGVCLTFPYLVMATQPSASLGFDAFPSDLKQSQESVQQQCNASVQSAMTRFENIRNVRVANFETIDLSERYRNYPPNSPVGVIFSLEGRAVNDVLNSPRLMTDISNQIITGCPPIGWVQIGLYQSSAYAIFGLINGNVTAFRTCIDGWYSEELLSWGEVYCF